MVIVDVQIALTTKFEAEAAMPGNLFQHVVEKPDTGLYGYGLGAVQVDLNRNTGFVG